MNGSLGSGQEFDRNARHSQVYATQISDGVTSGDTYARDSSGLVVAAPPAHQCKLNHGGEALGQLVDSARNAGRQHGRAVLGGLSVLNGIRLRLDESLGSGHHS